MFDGCGIPNNYKPAFRNVKTTKNDDPITDPSFTDVEHKDSTQDFHHRVQAYAQPSLPLRGVNTLGPGYDPSPGYVSTEDDEFKEVDPNLTIGGRRTKRKSMRKKKRKTRQCH